MSAPPSRARIAKAGSAGDATGGTKAGTANKAGTDAGGTTAGGGGTTGKGGASGGTTSEAGQSTGGEPPSDAGAAGMSAGGETGAAGAAGSDAGGAGGASGGMCPATIDLYPGIVAKAIRDKRVDCCMSDADKCMMEVGDAIDGIFTDLVQSEKDGLTAAIDGFCTGKAPDQTCAAFTPDGGACDVVNLCNVVTSYCDTGSKKCAPKLANGQTGAADLDCQSRTCDTADTKKCIPPSPKDECEYVPSGCSVVSANPRGGLAWSLLAGFVTLGVLARRRRR